MKNLILIVELLIFIASCNTPNDVNSNLGKYPKDHNITAANCFGAGETCDFPPSEEITDKCCEGLAPAPFSSSQDGSTGYHHYRCIYADRCTAENQDVEYSNYIPCCSGLIIMNEKCVVKAKCSAEKDQILVSAPLSQKKCIDFPACVKSGAINRSICEYCCPGSKFTTQIITGIPPEKCLGPDENLTQEESSHSWISPIVITQGDFDNFKTDCISGHHP